MTDQTVSSSAMEHLSMNDILDTVHFRTANARSNSALSDTVYEHILKELVFPDNHDQLRIGEKITEAMIASDLKVSNGPVRDAMARLRRENWIVTFNNRGSYIVDFTLPENSLAIYKFRLSVETGAFYTLARDINDDQLEELNACSTRIQEAAKQANFKAYRRADVEFHFKVLEMAGGDSLREFAAPKFLQWFALSRFMLKDTFDDDKSILSRTRSHEDLCRLLAGHDSAAAADLILQHCSCAAGLLGIID